MTVPLREVAGLAAAGRKAQTLARLSALGLPVLDGFVVLPDESIHGDLDRALATLGPGPYAVRSSSPLEDDVGGSAAGLYESLTGVGAPGVAAAIEAVRESADSEAVRAYLGARGLAPRPIAVLVQPQAEADLLAVARCDANGYRIEERRADAPEWADARPLELTRGSADPMAVLLGRVEAVMPGPLDVELARRGDHLTLLQVRSAAMTRPPRSWPARWPPGRWRLDAEHNPDPLSPAQAGLVALVDGPRFGPRARVIGGYLYVREDAAGPPPARDAEAALRRFRDELEPALRAELAAAEGAPLPEVLDVYRRVVRRYAVEVRPAIGAGRRSVDELLRAELGTSLADHGRLLGGTGGASTDRDAALYALGRAPDEEALHDYLARFGAYAPAWDVAVACDDEEPARLLAEAGRRALGPSPAALAGAAHALADDARRAIEARLPRAVRAHFSARLDDLRALLTLGENDDLLFFEGQRLVRRALLARGAALVEEGALARPADVFMLSLERAAAGGSGLRDEVAAARAALELAGRTPAPVRLVDGVAQLRVPESAEVLRGRAVGGHARGRAVVIRSLTHALGELPPGAVLVLPAALPSLAPHLPRLAGLVTEHGGALSHAATLAREAGVAAVVGVPGALEIPDGAELYVDGERGRVLLLRAPRGRGFA